MLVQHNYPANSSIGNFKEPEQNMRLSTFPIVSFYSRPLNVHRVCHTVSLPFSRSHGRFFTSHGFTNFEQILSQTYSFLEKQTQAAHFNVNKERISSMINKNKTNVRSSLSLS